MKLNLKRLVFRISITNNIEMVLFSDRQVLKVFPTQLAGTVNSATTTASSNWKTSNPVLEEDHLG